MITLKRRLLNMDKSKETDEKIYTNIENENHLTKEVMINNLTDNRQYLQDRVFERLILNNCKIRLRILKEFKFIDE